MHSSPHSNSDVLELRMIKCSAYRDHSTSHTHVHALCTVHQKDSFRRTLPQLVNSPAQSRSRMTPPHSISPPSHACALIIPRICLSFMIRSDSSNLPVADPVSQNISRSSSTRLWRNGRDQCTTHRSQVLPAVSPLLIWSCKSGSHNQRKCDCGFDIDLLHG